MEFVHKPVLYEEVMRLLHIRPDGVYLDGTLGGGGHASGIAKSLSSEGKLIGIDRDEEALRAAGERLAPYRDRTVLCHANFGEYGRVLGETGFTRVDGILLDLGVSSYQIDNPERGFSYLHDAPLDMRMDRSRGETAAELLERADADTIAEILRSYGEERFARQIAMRIVKVRETSPVRTTGELVSIIEKTIPQRFREKGGHVAKRTFQALRIAVNDELSGLSDTISGMIDHLSDGGRIAVITFHSLEDRIVKTAFHTAEDPCICPPDFPVCACGRKPKGIVITRKPVTASEEELADNSRAKSAKLRVFERHVEQG